MATFEHFRQTDLSFEELVECFKNANNNGEEPPCFYLNEIGVIAVNDKCEKAKKFLLNKIRRTAYKLRYIAVGFLGECDFSKMRKEKK